MDRVSQINSHQDSKLTINDEVIGLSRQSIKFTEINTGFMFDSEPWMLASKRFLCYLYANIACMNPA